jgi:hypothetical protein
MIRHACPNCDHEFHTPDELAGLPIQCWNCHANLVVPPKSVPEMALSSAGRTDDGMGEEPGIVAAYWQFFKEKFRGKASGKSPAPPS